MQCDFGIKLDIEMKRKPCNLNEFKRQTPKNKKMSEKVFLGVLGKTAPDYKVKEFLREWILRQPER